MKRKNGKLKFGVFGLVAIAVIVLIANPNESDFGNLFADSVGLKTNDINGGTFSSTGQLYALSFSNYFYQCNAEGELYAEIDGKWIKVLSDSDLFRTVIAGDIVKRNTSDVITKFRVDQFVTCDYSDPAITSLTTEGTLDVQIYTGPVNEKLLKGIDVNVPRKVLPDNVRTKIGQYVFTADSIESNLILTQNTGSGFVSVFSQYNGAYILNFDGGSNLFSTSAGTDSPVSVLRYYVQVLDNIQPTIEDASRTNSPIFITDIIQVKSNTSVMSKTMDLTDGHQIKMKATMRDYRETDGLPQVQIVGPGINVKLNLKLVGFTNDNDGLFENNFLIPRDTIGDWSVKFSHQLRSGESTRTFTTIDSGITQTIDPVTGDTTTTNEQGQIILVGGNTGSTGGGLDGPTVITKMHYIHRYEQVPDCDIDTRQCKLVTKTVSGIGDSQTLQLNSLTDSISFSGQSGVEAILDEIQITTVVSADFDTLKEFKRATKSDMVYQVTLAPAGATAFSFTPFTLHSPQPNICFGVTNESSCPPNGGMQLDVIQISNEKIELELDKKNISPDGQKVKITVKAIDGTFTLLDGANKEHLGSAKGTTYEYSFTYGGTPVNGGFGNNLSSSDSCTSSDPGVGCECPTGQVMTFSSDSNKLVCIDPTTGEETGSPPVSNTDNTADDDDLEPYCEIDTNGNVITTFGNVSIDDPGCALLYGDDDDTDNDDGQIEADPDTEAEGTGSTQPIIDCEEIFGVGFCALASGDTSEFFSPNGLDEEDNTLTIVGILVGIILLIAIVSVALKRNRANSY